MVARRGQALGRCVHVLMSSFGVSADSSSKILKFHGGRSNFMCAARSFSHMILSGVVGQCVLSRAALKTLMCEWFHGFQQVRFSVMRGLCGSDSTAGEERFEEGKTRSGEVMFDCFDCSWIWRLSTALFTHAPSQYPT